MIDPPRIADDEASEGAALLRAARRDAPPEDVLERTLSAIAAAAVVGALPAVAAAKVAKTGGAAMLKYVVVGFATGAVTVGGASAIYRFAAMPPRPEARLERAPAPARPPRARTAPETTAPVVTPNPPEEPRQTPPMADAAAPVRSPSLAKPPGGKTEPVLLPRAADVIAEDLAMAMEVRLLDEARRRIAEGRSRDALDVLARYAREAEGGRLSQEAAYLEMEANVALGDRASAKRAARDLLSRYPEGPHAPRAARILREE